MKFAVATTAIALLAHSVDAHGYLTQPAAYFPYGINTKYNAIMTESCDPAFAGLKWNDNPEANTAMFTKSFPNSQFKTLRAMMDTAASDCGNTALTGSPVDVSSLSSMKWQNDQEQMGFIDSHHGPCEAWIDDTRVFHSDDCRAAYTSYPAEIPIDYSACSGDCTFTFYWLALHEPNWQVYKQCAPIVNGSGGASTAQSPVATTAASAVTQNVVATVAPAQTDASTASEYTSPPATTTAATSAYTTTPSTESPVTTTTSNCKARRRRRMTANLRSEN
ncbi:hypothetical protein PHYSODRAFT_262844 [Phytophthora sojae]|uniref:Uncharacterized protein n=1 Tax=Phytophthora sojae (strain P6497) TaxID=1094619 RepID=G4ZBV5_PHYSP|nr:hypothetical protein PHYSODRAFT_262844 [Phytophthora sojae]EGZ21309.1 hypothetical protein PHYSODRAFT_262844 [Phytophthora sojae]|eukprot:XP_009524026.1 hypothetical protein PHYSODRAFT_262844 [Phytophthora sojae]